VQWFEVEARAAARMLPGYRNGSAPVPVDELVDVWLDAVADAVHQSTRVTGTGRDEHGEHECISWNAWSASKVMCAQFASQSDDPVLGRAPEPMRVASTFTTRTRRTWAAREIRELVSALTSTTRSNNSRAGTE
jgi:hypothetical protein